MMMTVMMKNQQNKRKGVRERIFIRLYFHII